MDSQKVKKRLFGTNGVRGIVGEDMTPELVLHIGLALGSMSSGTIAVGRDTRTSGEALANAIKAGVMATGCDAVDVGILPTPALQYLVRDEFDGGVMITASHNPPEWNGVKVIDADGTEMADEQVIVLEQRLFDRDFTGAAWDRVGKETAAPHLVERHVRAIVSAFPEGIGAGMTVVVDPGSGPAALTTPAILSQMGCRVLTINGQMDGTFPGRLPEPSVEGLAGLAELVVNTGAAFGVAHDGDADRAVFVDDTGQYVEENKEFALIESFACRGRNGIVVTPVSTSRIVEDVAERCECTVQYTPVGSIYVARCMMRLIGEGKNVLFGGEGNGGLIFPEHQFCRDGGMTVATMVHLLASKQSSLSAEIGDLPQYTMIKEKIHTRRAAEILDRIEDAYRDESIDRTDGLKVSRGDAWALVRASGTEPLVRIMVESKDKTAAETLYRDISRRIMDLTGSA